MFLKTIKILLICIILFSSCKSKKKVTSSNKRIKPNTERVVKTFKENDKKETTSTKIKPTPKNASYSEIVAIYIDNYYKIAKEEMMLYGIPASITLAQGILESGAGRAELSRKSNNHFGIKCHKEWTGEREYHDDDELQECFRKYDDPDDSYRDHSLFLSSRARYIELFDLKEDDYKGWAKGLQRAGYATDIKYPEKLISIIEKHELYRFDDEVLGRKSKRSKKKDKRSGTVGTYIVQKGDTLWAISSNFNMTIKSIKELNRLNTDTIYEGQVLKIYK